MTESNEFHYFSCIKLSIFFKEHHINKKVVERLGFFCWKEGWVAFLVLATCSWEMCEVNVLLKGTGGSFAPLLGDIAGLQPWQHDVPSWCHFVMESEVARTCRLDCNPGLLSHLQDRKAKDLLCTELLGDAAQRPAGVPGHRRCEPLLTNGCIEKCIITWALFSGISPQ